MRQLEEGLRIHVTLKDEGLPNRDVKIRMEIERAPAAMTSIDDMRGHLRDVIASLDNPSSVTLEVSRHFDGVQFTLAMDFDRDTLTEVQRFLEQIDTVSGIYQQR